MAGRDQINEEKPSPFSSPVAFRRDFAVTHCGDKSFSACCPCSAYHCPLGRLSSIIKHVLWTNWDWKEKVIDPFALLEVITEALKMVQTDVSGSEMPDGH